ncbi:DUF4189 domain-containing protein [Stenotrophomonas sp. NPDC078853]|uniref:DUF4189 domain-containing protein n=1 Tax=Stenotrophomonas sp. NPDC078853 TaxID=3364534 RepID=UPI00384BD9E2
MVEAVPLSTSVAASRYLSITEWVDPWWRIVVEHFSPPSASAELDWLRSACWACSSSHWAAVAYAEGRCPPGQYPIGGQGVGGCAPIPGYGGNQTAQPARPPIDPGRYEDRSGAMALSDSTPDAGVMVDQLTEGDAKRVAIEECSRNGLKDCRILLTYQCAAWVVPSEDAPGARPGISAGLSEQAAVENATSKCKHAPGRSCVLAYSACSLSQRTRWAAARRRVHSRRHATQRIRIGIC